MGISIYFGEREEALAGGFGFTEAGLWRGGAIPKEAGGASEACAPNERYPSTGLEAGPPPLQAGEVLAAPAGGGTAGLVVDDRFLPDRRGAEAVRRALGSWKGLVICDFERPPSPLLAELVRSLAGARVVLPPAWAALPHAAVLVGPWTGELPFSRWLENQRARYGEIVLDGLPLRAAAAPGGPWEPWPGALPAMGFPCPGLGSLHRRLPDGRIVFWDTRETLMVRIRSVDVPVIVFSEDWERLRER